MPPEIMPPEPLARARELGLCRYVHLTVQVSVPPASGGTPVIYLNLPDEMLTGIKYEMPAVNIIKLYISPPPNKEFVWRTFALVWGALSPAGVTLDVVITHGQVGMIPHSDPWLHSLVDYSYPHSLTLTWGYPEFLIIENNTPVMQTLDVSLHFMSFTSQASWEKYLKMLEKGLL